MNGHPKKSAGSLTLVLPVYNEAVLLPKTFASVCAFIDGCSLKTDVIFVNDGSPDDSGKILKSLIRWSKRTNIRLIQYKKNQGKGYAVKTGILAAKGDFILMSDTDLSTPLTEWVKLKNAIDQDAAMACGSRAVAGADMGKPPPLHRRMLSKVFNLLVHMAGVRGIRDTQCGFKLFTRPAAQKIFSSLRTNRFAFDVEAIARARDLGFQVVEIPVHWDYSGHSTVKVFSSGSRMLWDLLRLVFRRWVKK